METTKMYKSIPVSTTLYPLMRYMQTTEEYREELSNLSKDWDNLALLAQLSGAKTNIGDTQEEFTHLTAELLNHLARETLEKTASEMTAKAQVAVDIVIRNLYERTADIGFLATDEEIRQFLRTTVSVYDPHYKNGMHRLKERFKEYCAKYSVYFDIILMTKKGDILLSLGDNGVSTSKDSLLNLVLSTQEDYVESYKHHDFLPHLENSLIYSYRVTETNDKLSPTLGILHLCFRFNDEMRGIFRNLVSLQNKECLMLLDNTGKVIASSDRYHIPLGAIMETNLHNPYKIVSFGGRDYLAKTCKTHGYQGFRGMGWYGHIMVPVEHAFNGENEPAVGISRESILAILQNGEDFSEELKAIPLHAGRIQEKLNRALWNGSISYNKEGKENKNFSRLLLQEIGKTGLLTKEIFNASIINLTQTIMLNNTTAVSSLMIDIMDRNLYERANDCRWWALTPDFSHLLEKSEGEERREGIEKILHYINTLYTVYTTLFVYDTQGVIIGVSKPNERSFVGKKLTKSWVAQTLRLRDSSRYCVSDFEPDPLYDNNPTYIYNAAIRSLVNPDEIVGGIGIVFHSQNELQQMLVDALPKQSNGEIKQGIFGFFTTQEKTIISSSRNTSDIGTTLSLDDKFFRLSQGESYNEIIIFEGNYYAVGVTCSQGYREYKSAGDEYVNNVFAFFFSFISKANLTLPHIVNSFTVHTLPEETQEKHEIATFIIGERWLGVYGCDIIEAVSVDMLQESITLNTTFHFKGTLLYNNRVVSVLDLREFVKENEGQPYSDIVIVKYGIGALERYIGILVHALGDIVEVPTSRITPIDKFFVSNGAIMDSIVVPENKNSGSQALTILNIEKVGKELVIHASRERG